MHEDLGNDGRMFDSSDDLQGGHRYAGALLDVDLGLTPDRRFQDQDILHGLTRQGRRPPFQTVAVLVAIVR
jgi:hypothetical protein